VTPVDALSAQVPAFCEVLRKEHGFSIGQAEAHDSLRALDALGVTDRARVRAALRLVCCGKRPDVEAFDDAFERFFTQLSPGVAQPAYAPRHTRPGREDAPDDARDPAAAPDRPRALDEDPAEGDGGRAAERRPTGEERHDTPPSLAALRARYSPLFARSEPPAIDRSRDAAMFAAAGRLIAAVRLGRSRRWQMTSHVGRFDLRRTVRASLQTGGEAVTLHYRGHPLRNPRFALLIDGSRSVAEHTNAIVAFSRALVSRSLRTNVFFFSTELRDVTRELREVTRGTHDRTREPQDRTRELHASNVTATLGDLGAAWGGGTKIGASLATFVDRHAARVLSPDTVVIVFSDGLDVGDASTLVRAMREIDRRSAGIVWLNPHASTPGFSPTARGMRAALPYITILTSAHDPRDFERLADQIARHPRIRGRRK